MTGKTLEIVLFVMPWEIDAYAESIRALAAGLLYLPPGDRVTLDATMSVADDLVDWTKSRVPKSRFIERFRAASSGWGADGLFDVDDTGAIQGVVAKRRQNIARTDPNGHVMWLDPDIVFPPYALRSIVECLHRIDDRYFVLTPQTHRMWDASWDPLVHADFLEKPLGFCYEHDVAELAVRPDPGPAAIRELDDFKFAGGLLATFPAALLKLLGIPDSFAPYGGEDDFVMLSCRVLKAVRFPVRQYVITNLVVAQELREDRGNAHLGDLVRRLDKQVMRDHNRAILDDEVRTAVLRVLGRRSLSLVQRFRLHQYVRRRKAADAARGGHRP